MRITDVLIVGAGPAGSVCGSLLKQAGVDCVIVDHADFPRDKVCGGGLTVKAWRLLDSLLPGLTYDFRPINRIRIQFEDDALCEFNTEHPIRMTLRKDFDYSLLQYYKKLGGELIKGSFARFKLQDDGRVLVRLKSGEELLCKYLVAADGGNSRIRRQIAGPVDMKQHALFLEYYVEGEHNDDVFVHFSHRYKPGVFYRFSSNGRDMYGFASVDTNEDFPRHLGKFRETLTKFQVPEGNVRGAYIPLKTVCSPTDNIILIGDAGGFPNKLTGEGLYDAFKTAYNASRAIIENKSFKDTNAEVFQKMKKQQKVYQFFFSRFGFWLLRRLLHYPGAIKWLFDTKMKREGFVRNR